MSEAQSTSTKIFDSVKEALGVYTSDDSFDTEITMHINGALARVSQVGIIKDMGYVITKDEEWDDIFDVDVKEESKFLAKQFVFVTTKRLFDAPPPNTAAAMDALANEYLWRIEIEHPKEVTNNEL